MPFPESIAPLLCIQHPGKFSVVIDQSATPTFLQHCNPKHNLPHVLHAEERRHKSAAGFPVWVRRFRREHCRMVRPLPTLQCFFSPLLSTAGLLFTASWKRRNASQLLRFKRTLRSCFQTNSLGRSQGCIDRGFGWTSTSNGLKKERTRWPRYCGGKPTASSTKSKVGGQIRM